LAGRAVPRSTLRPQRTLGDELANLGIGLLIGAAVPALLLRAAAAVAAWATGIAQPTGGPETGLAGLLDPGDPSAAMQAPGLHPVSYRVTAIVLLGAVGAVGIWLWRMLLATGRTTKLDRYRIPGIATRTNVRRAAWHTALMRRATHPRSSLTNPNDVGYRIGHSRGTIVWASVEDSMLVIGPPRCEDPLTAMIRATGLAAGTGLATGGVDGGGFWEAKTRTALQALLHAAALDHRPPAELFRWTSTPPPPTTRSPSCSAPR
jgi:hypothetical protein